MTTVVEDRPIPQISSEPGNINPPPAANQTSQQNILVTAKGGGLSFLGRIFEYIVRFVFSVVVARTLGAEQYGLYTLGLTLAQITSMLALLGLQTGMVRFLAPAIRQKDSERVWGIIQVCLGLPALLSLVFAACLFLLAAPISAIAFHEPRMVPIIQLVSLSIPLDAVAFIAYVIVISFKQPKYLVLVSNIIAPVVKLVLTIGLLAVGSGTMGAIIAHVAASAVGLGSIIFFVTVLFPFRRPSKGALRYTGELLRYSLPVHLGWVFNSVRGTLETLILGFVGLTTGVGIYAVALRLSAVGSMLFLSIGNISTPVIADLYSRGENLQLKSFYQTTTKWILMFNLPLFLTIVLFASPILSIFGEGFTNGAQGLMILALGTLVYTGTGLGANILDMTDHTKLNSANSAFMIVISIALDLLLIPRLGVLGAAIASAFSTVLVNVVCLVEVLILLKMQPYELGVLKPLLAGAISAALTYFIDPYMVLSPLLHLIVGSLILWGGYGLIMILLGFSDDDLLVILSIRSRLKILTGVRTPLTP